MVLDVYGGVAESQEPSAEPTHDFSGFDNPIAYNYQHAL